LSSLDYLMIFAGMALALSFGMAVAWLIWRKSGNSGWVDTIWTFSVGITGVSATFLIHSTGVGPRQILIAMLVAAWTLRLGLHIALRTRAISDDPRYAKLVREWGADAKARMFWLLQKQAWVSIPLVMAIAIAAGNPAPGLRLQDWLGAAILLVAIVGEAAADYQLRLFRSQNPARDAVCDTGLWAWSRHPNYFFQWLGWLAYPVIAIDVDGDYPWAWFALIAPFCMYWLLAYVSGIPPLEEHMLATRGNRYRAYVSRTSAFFPFPPRRGSMP